MFYALVSNSSAANGEWSFRVRKDDNRLLISILFLGVCVCVCVCVGGGGESEGRSRMEACFTNTSNSVSIKTMKDIRISQMLPPFNV